MRENVFPWGGEKLSLQHMEGLVWDLVGIKTVFYTSLLYMLEQDLSSALSLSHKLMAAFPLLQIFVISKYPTERSHFLKAKQEFLLSLFFGTLDQIRHGLFYVVCFTVHISPLAALIISFLAHPPPLFFIFLAVMSAVSCPFFQAASMEDICTKTHSFPFEIRAHIFLKSGMKRDVTEVEKGKGA